MKDAAKTAGRSAFIASAVVRLPPRSPRRRVNAEQSGGNADAMVVSRRDARLLAKRINQCLDATRKG